MWFRFLVIASILFCGVMTTLLVRSVYFPEFDRLPEVDPEHVLELFLGAHDPTYLYVYREGEAVADIRLTPRHLKVSGDVSLTFAATGAVALPGLAEQNLNWSGRMRLGERPERKVKGLELRVNFSDPKVSVQMEIDPDAMEFHYRVSQGGVVVTDSRSDPNAIGIVQARMLMTAWGFSPEKVEAELQGKADQFSWMAKQGTIEIAGHRAEAFFVVLQVPGAGEVRMTFTEAGELLELTTPLGYEILSEALRRPPDPLPYNK
jgi:hypothetical protein